MYYYTITLTTQHLNTKIEQWSKKKIKIVQTIQFTPQIQESNVKSAFDKALLR
jgi:hypothetical protein